MRHDIRGRAGFTFIELMIALSILAIGLVTLLSMQASNIYLVESNEETTQAYQAASEQIEALWALDFDEVYDEVYVTAGGSVDEEFDVGGLDRIDDATPVGRIILIIDESGTSAAASPYKDLLGLNRDNDGDGTVDQIDIDGDGTIDGGAVDHSGDYQLLPYVIEITWKGAMGQYRQIQVPGMLARRE